MTYDIEDGRPIPLELKESQFHFVPTMNSHLINVSYQLECVVAHDGVINSKQEVPSLFWPIVVTLDPMGPIEHPQAYQAPPQNAPASANPYAGQAAQPVHYNFNSAPPAQPSYANANPYAG